MLSNEWVNEWLLFNAKWAIFQPNHDENMLHFDEMTMMMSTLYYTNMLSWISIVLGHIILIPSQPV
jgi:hypothetical protein